MYQLYFVTGNPIQISCCDISYQNGITERTSSNDLNRQNMKKTVFAHTPGLDGEKLILCHLYFKGKKFA